MASAAAISDDMFGGMDACWQRVGIALALGIDMQCIYLQISIVNRTDEDELLLLASDGLWDVMSNQACRYEPIVLGGCQGVAGAANGVAVVLGL